MLRVALAIVAAAVASIVGSDTTKPRRLRRFQRLSRATPAILHVSTTIMVVTTDIAGTAIITVIGTGAIITGTITDQRSKTPRPDAGASQL
jgi:hypothetical protein